MEAAAGGGVAGGGKVAEQTVSPLPGGTRPLTAASSVEEVANWVLQLDLSGKEGIAVKVREEDVDGDALFSCASKQEVQAALRGWNPFTRPSLSRRGFRRSTFPWTEGPKDVTRG